MKCCEQASGLSIYQHGLDVANRYRDLYFHLQGESAHYRWAIKPEILESLKKIAIHADHPKQARVYHIFHDCGKPFCLSIDSEGRRHFPDHAKKSAEIYRELFPDDHRTAELIEMDMLCHTAKGEEIEALALSPLAPTLIITAWAELHANAEALFGGFETTSFKIKAKQLCKITKRILEKCTQHCIA